MTLKEVGTQFQKFLLMAILAALVVFTIDALLIPPSDYAFLTQMLLLSLTGVFGWLWERHAGTESDWLGNLILALVLLGAGVVMMIWRWGAEVVMISAAFVQSAGELAHPFPFSPISS